MRNAWTGAIRAPLFDVRQYLPSLIHRVGQDHHRSIRAFARSLTKSQKTRGEQLHHEKPSHEESWFNEALHHLPVGISVFDRDRRLVICNSAYRKIYEVPEELSLPGTLFTELMRNYADKQTGAESADELESIGNWSAEFFAKLAAGKPFTDLQQLSDGRTIFARVGPMANGGWVDVLEDITERQENEAKIAHMARHDALTDLPNRVSLQEWLELTAKTARRGEYISVLCLDLDRFKEVNDTLGHPVGDAVLKAVADRLRGSIRQCDIVARISGDEFVVVQLSSEQPDDTAGLASRIIELISAPYSVGDHNILIGTSIGIAVALADSDDAETILGQADMALYASKADGRGTYRFFEPDMNTRAHARRNLEQDLRLAITNGELELHYQPLVNLKNQNVSGFEALLRWRHPQRGMVSPADFIPLAEETGLILPIGEWALRQACTEAATWPEHIKIAVNLSPMQFKGGKLVAIVLDTLATTGLTASRLELEITESSLLQDSEATLATLYELHNCGVRIAMDDFGTGYSSLAYLQKFPFDKIKIDRCFVSSQASGDLSSLAIVRAVNCLGRTLGLSITAEGVETEEQLEMVRFEGCTEMQGYLFSSAKPADQIRHYFLPPTDAGSREDRSEAVHG